eukprot:99104-Hanusia_phi.AAC.1
MIRVIGAAHRARIARLDNASPRRGGRARLARRSISDTVTVLKRYGPLTRSGSPSRRYARRRRRGGPVTTEPAGPPAAASGPGVRRPRSHALAAARPRTRECVTVTGYPARYYRTVRRRADPLRFLGKLRTLRRRI